jgi:hypothetical protein
MCDLIDKHKRHADLGITYTLSDSRQLSRDTIAEIERLTARAMYCSYRVAELEGAIEFAFNNASNSFLGINFSFDAAKRLRAALRNWSTGEG